MKKLTFTLLLALMAIFSAQAAKVYLKIGEGRVTAESDIAVWAWDDSNNFCTNGWPGDKLTEKRNNRRRRLFCVYRQYRWIV